MFPTRKPVLFLHLNGQVIRTTADHPFFVSGHGWTSVANLQVGDPVRTHDEQDVPLEAITDSGKEEVVYPMDLTVPPFPCTGLWPAGTLLETAEGLKPVEDIQVGERIVVRDPPDPERN